MIANIIRPLKYRVQRSVLVFLQQNLTLCPSLYRTKQINWSEKNQTCFFWGEILKHLMHNLVLLHLYINCMIISELYANQIS